MTGSTAQEIETDGIKILPHSGSAIRDGKPGWNPRFPPSDSPPELPGYSPPVRHCEGGMPQ